MTNNTDLLSFPCLQYINLERSVLQKPKNTSVDNGGMYNVLNETSTDPEETSSHYDQVQYNPTNWPQQADFLDNGYLHANKPE